MCIGIEDNVTLVSSARPAWVSRPDFQVGILAATLSTNACSSARFSRESERGMPRYLHGKGLTSHHTREHLLYLEYHLLQAADWGSHTLIDISDETRRSGEQVKDLQQALQVARNGSDQDDEVARLLVSTSILPFRLSVSGFMVL